MMAPWEAITANWKNWNDLQRVSAATGIVFIPLYIAHSWGFKPAFLIALIFAFSVLVVGFGDNGRYVSGATRLREIKV